MSPSSSRRARLLALAGLAALVALAFGGSLGGDFVWDDAHLILRNPAMQDQAGWRPILGRDLWGQATDRPTQLYHPIPMLTFWAQARLAGLAVWPMRLVNVLLHASAVALAFRWMTRAGLPPLATWGAAAVLLVHPSVTEPVSWLTGRHDVLAVVFVMAGLVVWPNANAKHRVARASASGVAFAFAFLCKEPYVVAPGLAFLATAFERHRERPSPPSSLVVPLLLSTGPLAGAIGLRLGLGIPLSAERSAAPVLEHARAYVSVVAHYGTQLLTFGNGSTIEPYEPLSAWAAAAVGVLLGTAVCALAWGARRRIGHLPLALLGLAWFLLSLAPHVISVPSIGLYGNRYGYFGLFGLATCVAACVASLRVSAELERVAIGAAGLASLILSLVTRADASAFRDNLTLFGRDVEHNPRNGHALYHLGTAVLSAEGCVAALPVFVRAAEYAPMYARPFQNVAGCALNVGKPDVAAKYGARAVELAPTNPGAHFNLGAALVDLGQISEGRRHLETALALNPQHAKARNLLQRLAGAAASPRASAAPAPSALPGGSAPGASAPSVATPSASPP